MPTVTAPVIISVSVAVTSTVVLAEIPTDPVKLEELEEAFTLAILAALPPKSQVIDLTIIASRLSESATLNYTVVQEVEIIPAQTTTPEEVASATAGQVENDVISQGSQDGSIQESVQEETGTLAESIADPIFLGNTEYNVPARNIIQNDVPGSDVPKWVVVLTTSRTREDVVSSVMYAYIYIDSIVKWSNLSLQLIVVENSGVGYPELANLTNLDVVVSNTSDEYAGSKSMQEASSLEAVMEHMKNHPMRYGKSTHLLKVTGRYFLEGIEESIKKLPQGKDFYVQRHYDANIKWQNSEYFGIRKELLPEVTSTVLLGDNEAETTMEHALWKVSRDHSFAIFDNTDFHNEMPRGGDGLVFNPL